MTDQTMITAEQFLEKVLMIAQAIGWQAGVGGMETAGSLVSYLGRFPEKLPAFMADGFSMIDDMPTDWLTQGCLTWHAANGKVVHPEFVPRASVIRDMEKGL